MKVSKKLLGGYRFDTNRQFVQHTAEAAFHNKPFKVVDSRLLGALLGSQGWTSAVEDLKVKPEYEPKPMFVIKIQ